MRELVLKAVKRPRSDSGGTTVEPLLLLSANSVWNVLNFRMKLVEAFRAEGFAVAVAAPPHPDSEQLERRGVRFYPIPLRPSGTSPLGDLRLLLAYRSLLRRLRPAAFLGFTPKPNIYGSIAAAGCGIPVVNNVTGLGTAFIASRALERLVVLLYRLAFRKSEAVFFHNPDDLALFARKKMVRPDRAIVIPGSGIDLERFQPTDLPGAETDPRFLFIGRLIDEKGVREFAAAAALVKQSLPAACFQILGPADDSSRAISAAELGRWVADGRVDYLGTCGDVRPHIAGADCVVLPSYREGMPRVLLEAAAMARPVIAADVPGCRHAVVDGETGFLCEVRSGDSLAEAIGRFVRLSPADRSRMGLRGRELVEENFGEERVTAAYLSVLRRFRAAPPAA